MYLHCILSAVTLLNLRLLNSQTNPTNNHRELKTENLNEQHRFSLNNNRG